MARLRVLFTADWHLSNRLPYAERTRGMLTDRLEHQRTALEKVAQHVRDYEVDLVYVLGDIFHRSTPDYHAFEVAIDILRGLLNTGAEVRVVAGNHDMATSDPNGASHTLDVLDDALDRKLGLLHSSAVVGGTPPVVFNAPQNGFVSFAELGYMRKLEPGLIEGLRKQVRRLGPCYLVTHLPFYGGVSGAWVCDEGVEPSKLDFFEGIFSGHFHQRQQLSLGDGKVARYVGSPYQLDFGESLVQGSVMVVDFKSKEAKPAVKAKRISAPRFFTTESYKGPGKERQIAAGDYLRYHITCSREQWRRKERMRERLFRLWIDRSVHVYFEPQLVSTGEDRFREQRSEVSQDTRRSIDAYVDAFAGDEGEGRAEELKRAGAQIFDDVTEEL